MICDFISIDFETAQSPWADQIFICQIGIVVIKNGACVEEISYLVQPPSNKYEKSAIAVHGITPEQTKNAPAFDKIWPKIEKYFVNTLLVAHNASDFDEKVLYTNLSHYKIYPKGINKFIDTKYLFDAPSRSLEALCYGFGVECENHHDALSDAKYCAFLYLKYLTNQYPNAEAVISYRDNNKRTEKANQFYKQPKDWDARNISPEMKKQDLSVVQNRNTIFYDKKIVISGVFELFPLRDDLALLLKGYGADINGSISSKTNMFIIGRDCGPKKMEKVFNLNDSGYNIRIVEEKELLNILQEIEDGEKRNS